MKILIADTDQKSTQSLCSDLRALGHECFETYDGAHTIQVFEQLMPDLVLIDFNVSNPSALITVQELRKRSFDIFEWRPIIFLSVDDSDETIIEAIDAGADDFMKKPCPKGLMYAKVKAMQRLLMMRQNLIDYGQQLRMVNDNLLSSTQLLNELSLKDPLTLIGNRRAFQENLDKAIRSATREGEPLAMIMIDIDYFKKFNDKLGHQKGDDCLKEVAQLFAKTLHRPKDVIARFGGEEFAILLENTDLKGASMVAERLRVALLNQKIKHPESEYCYVTASFGVAYANPHRQFQNDELLRIADLALYQAKREGRNCVVSCPEPVELLKQNTELTFKKYA